VVQALIDEITESLAQGDTVVMRNFGTFEVREMKAKIGRNLKQPGKDVPIPARAAVKFKPGKELKEKVATTLHVVREHGSRLSGAITAGAVEASEVGPQTSEPDMSGDGEILCQIIFRRSSTHNTKPLISKPSSRALKGVPFWVNSLN